MSRSRISRPRTDRPRRARPLPIGWMVLALAGLLYLAGSNIGSGWVVVLTAALVGAVVLDLATVVRAHGRTEVTARLEASGTTTAPLDLVLQVVRPPSPTTLHLSTAPGPAAHGRAATDPVGHDPASDLRALVRTADATIDARTHLPRGRHEHLPLVLRTTGPLGLVDAVRTADVAVASRVRPGARPAVARIRALVGADGLAARARSGGDEVRGVREHVAGDPRRAVHWRATARHGQLMVRDATALQGAPVRIGIGPGTWSRVALDVAAEVAVSLAVAADEAGHPVELLVDGAVVPWDDRAWHLLASLPPAAGVAARPLAPTTGGATVWLVAEADGVLVDGGRGGPTVLADAEAARAWLRGGT